MRRRKLGKTGLEVSELSLGTWGLSGDTYGTVSDSDAKGVVQRAEAMGINLFETADSYGRGRMETLLGTSLLNEQSIVVTKWGTDLAAIPSRKQFEASYLRKAAEGSRTRLGEKMRIVALLHNPTAATVSNGEASETMKALVKEGLIESWGVSAGSAEVAQASITAEAPILSFAYNILQVQPLRSLEASLREGDVGVLAHSVLFYGLLTGRWTQNKTFRSSDHRSQRWAPGTLASRIRHLDGVRPLVSGDVLSLRSAAVRFVLSNEVVSSVILGPKSSIQLDQLVRENRSEPPYLSEAKLSALESRLQHLKVER